MSHHQFLLVDISNSFSKLAIAEGGKLKKQWRLSTSAWDAEQIFSLVGKEDFDGVIVSSVVPRKNKEFARAIKESVKERIHWVHHLSPLGIQIDYPHPESIGADRLANAVGCVAHYGYPAIVVDFGTAVTFDVLSSEGAYTGGVIAPGLSAMTHYLHEQTALLPKIQLEVPRRVVGKTTREAMNAGAIFGYRGLVREICGEINREISPASKVPWIATGGDAELVSRETSLFDAVDPDLTLRGMLQIGQRLFSGE